MKAYTYRNLPQLQALIFSDEGGEGTPDLGQHNYRGVMVVIKLNDQCMITLSELLSEKDEGKNKTPLPVEVKDTEAEVVPVDVGITEGRLHAIVVRAGLGHTLINLSRRH